MQSSTKSSLRVTVLMQQTLVSMTDITTCVTVTTSCSFETFDQKGNFLFLAFRSKAILVILNPAGIKKTKKGKQWG